MSDKKISQLTASSTPLAGTEVLPVVQSGVTKQVSVANLTAGRSVNVASLQATAGAVAANTSTYSGASLSGISVATKASTDLIGTYPNGLSFTLVNGGAGWPIGITQGVLITYYSNNFGADGIGFSYQEFSARNPSGVDVGLRRYFRRYPVNGDPGAAWSSWQEIIAADTTTGNATIHAGNLVIGTAGKGIDFSADPSAAGMTSELLDDYEEGTWTPSLGGTATYTQRSGTYTKVGNIVYANCLIQVNLIGTGSSTTISGLPFTTVNRSLGSCPYFNTINTSVVFLTPFADGNSANVKFLGATGATPNPTDGISIFRDGAYVILSVAYTV